MALLIWHGTNLFKDDFVGLALLQSDPMCAFPGFGHGLFPADLLAYVGSEVKIMSQNLFSCLIFLNVVCLCCLDVWSRKQYKFKLLGRLACSKGRDSRPMQRRPAGSSTPAEIDPPLLANLRGDNGEPGNEISTVNDNYPFPRCPDPLRY